jgi:hypothetical protein
MQSGPIVAVRAVVMLACMIVVPLVAIFWKHWPQAIDLARGGRWTELAELGTEIVTKSGPQPTTMHVDTQEAPTFGDSRIGNGASAGIVDASPTSQANPFAPPALASPAMITGDVAPANTTVPAGAALPIAVPAAHQVPATDVSPLELHGSPIPVSAATLAPLPAQLTPQTPLPAEPQVEGPPQSNPFRELEQRLRSLGATYYLLESWGTEGNLYRFHVKMAMAGNPNYNRHFEATDADPLTAMSRVLDEVELWRSGRQP